MRTTIGQTLHDSPRLAVAGLIGALAVAADFALEWWSKELHYLNAAEGRGAVALFGLAAYIYLVQGDLKSLGLTLRPIQGWWYWVKATLLIGLAFAGIVAAGLGLLALCGSKHATTLRAMPPQFLGVAFLHMCVFAPVLEETLYRLLVCVPLAGWKRPWTAIVVSGVIFAALHFVYGNPSPENAVGGLFLAWAYLKSETVVVPVLLHALGNFLILAMQVAAWYCLAPNVRPESTKRGTGTLFDQGGSKPIICPPAFLPTVGQTFLSAAKNAALLADKNVCPTERNVCPAEHIVARFSPMW